MRAIDRCEVALLVVDATTGLTAQDAHIAGYIMEAYKSIVVVANKWDAVEKDNESMNDFTRHVRDALNFLAYVPILFISAKTGQRVEQVMPMALRVQEERLARLSTSQLNKILQYAQDKHSPSNASGRALKIFYGTQVRSDPPTFLLYVNDPKIAHFSYLRYLENTLREEYPCTGTPIRLVLKARH
jgi:GTP-binding protein